MNAVIYDVKVILIKKNSNNQPLKQKRKKETSKKTEHKDHLEKVVLQVLLALYRTQEVDQSDTRGDIFSANERHTYTVRIAVMWTE